MMRRELLGEKERQGRDQKLKRDRTMMENDKKTEGGLD